MKAWKTALGIKNVNNAPKPLCGTRHPGKCRVGQHCALNRAAA